LPPPRAVVSRHLARHPAVPVDVRHGPGLAADEHARPGSPSRRACSSRRPGTHRAPPRRRRRTRGPPRRGRETGPNPGGPPGKPEIPTMADERSVQPEGAMACAVAARPSPPDGLETVPVAWFTTTRPVAPRRRARRCWWHRTARPGAHSSSRRPGRSPPSAGRGSPVFPDSSESTARPEPWRTGNAAASAARSRRYCPGGSPPAPSRRARPARCARHGPPRREPGAIGPHPRATNPTGNQRRHGGH
jgi:hypothetical protein